jgi:hypothetical protein
MYVGWWGQEDDIGRQAVFINFGVNGLKADAGNDWRQQKFGVGFDGDGKKRR